MRTPKGDREKGQVGKAGRRDPARKENQRRVGEAEGGERGRADLTCTR